MEIKDVNVWKPIGFKQMQGKRKAALSLWPFPLVTMFAVFCFFMYGFDPKVDFDFSKVNPNLIDTIMEIKNQDDLALRSIVGQAAITPKAYLKGRWLMANASNEDLQALLEFPNGAIKALAFKGLLVKKDDHIVEYLMNISDDENVVYAGGGCMAWPTVIGEYCLNELGYSVPNGSPPLNPNQHFKLSNEQLTIVQQKIMATKNKLNLEFF